MASRTCPICDEGFETPGEVRSHAWDTHAACHYCGEHVDADAEAGLYKHWLAAHPDDLSTVDYKRATAEVDSLTFSERLSNGGVGRAVAGLPRRYFLIAGGSTVAGAIAVGGALFTDVGGGGSGGGLTSDEYEYARMGSDQAGTTITYYGNYKCPFCARFDTGLLQDIQQEYVASGDLAIRYRNLSYIDGQAFLGPDAITAGHAGLAVYNNEPGDYWDYHHYVYANQGRESRRWATKDRLMEFAESAGVSDPSVIGTAIEESLYENALRASDNAAQEAEVTGTPMLVIDGTAINPLENEAVTRNRIEDAIASG